MLTSFLILSVSAVYWQIHSFQFVNFDDPVYITTNKQLQQGFTRESIIWALTTNYAGNWHPLTWWSHLVDISLFGFDPGKHHLFNLLFHLGATCLVFLVFRRIFKNMMYGIWQAFLVASLFGLHPLHVESVAWVSERKDVLSAFFWFLSMYYYFAYVDQSNQARIRPYLLSLIFFTAGLLSKPTLVTLPFVLLLMDFWPLKRLTKQSVIKVIQEKIPFLILTGLTILMTMQAFHGLKDRPLSDRAANSILAYSLYLFKTLWPFDLIFFYPFPDTFNLLEILGACFLLVGFSYLVLKKVGLRPWLFVGWFWFTGTLVPMIGIIQQGNQAMADRYMYIPLCGLALILTQEGAEFFKKIKFHKIIMGVIVYLTVLSMLAWQQTSYWKTSRRLFQHALDVSDNNFMAHINLGFTLAQQGNYDAAIPHFYRTLELDPLSYNAHNNLGIALIQKGNIEEGLFHYSAALNLNPFYYKAHINIGNTLLEMGKISDAIRSYSRALQINPAFDKNDPSRYKYIHNIVDDTN